MIFRSLNICRGRLGDASVDRRWIVGRWTGCGSGACRHPVHPGERRCSYRRRAARICVRLGVAGRVVGAVQRPTAALGSCDGRVLCPGRPDLTSSARLGGAEGVRLGAAAAATGTCDLDDSSGAPAAAQPNPAVAGVPAAGGVRLGLGRRRLRDRTRVDRRDRIPCARPAHRRRRTPATPELHRLRQPHSRPGAGSWGSLLGDGVDRASRCAGHQSVRV
jgi:hypothetical protein